MTFPGRWTRVRILACGVVLVVLFVAVGKRAFNLQVREAERLRAMAEEQYLREVELPPRRGRILDRNGAELASTADVDSIYCNPRRLPDPADAARRLAKVLGMDRRELEKKLQQRRFFTWVKRKVTPDEAAAVKALALPGVAFVKEPRRFYPNRSLAATVMGLAGADGRGLDGVELAFDKALTGTTSSVVGIRDALGRDLAVEGLPDTPTGVGSDVVLTIDRYLTFVTERAIADGQARTHAKDIVAIVMNPQTGELLAMASVPTFNPNDPSEAAGARDRAITDAYEPGSTMKTFTIASALDAGVVRAEDRIDCLQGKMMVGKYSIHDTHAHGVITVSEVFKFSSNIGATKIARKLGRDGLADALGRFGFGHPTGVGLPGERSGIIRPVDKWGDIGFANVSFGQGLTVTPLQMVTGVSAIAAGGMYHAPRVVLRVVQPDGTVEASASAAAAERRVMSESAAHTMLGIMRGVTEEGGTAKQAAIEGYVVGGKTGTAQKVANGHYDPNKWVSSFVGVVPIEAPRLAIIVVVDEPQGGHLGGAVAAPIFKEIAEQALRYLHVPPSVEVPVVAAKAKAAAPPAKAAADADDAPSAEGPPTELPVYADADGPGDDPALAEQWNAIAGAEGGRGGAVAPAPTAIPNFAGMTMGEAIRAAHKSGVELAFDDATGTASGVVLAQNPPPGPTSRGALCRVALGRRE